MSMTFRKFFQVFLVISYQFTNLTHLAGSFVHFPIYVIDSTVYKSVAYMWRVLPHHATLLPQMVFRVPPPIIFSLITSSLRRSCHSAGQRPRRYSSARFSSRETFRRAYCKRLALRNRFQLTEAEFDDDLFVFGQFHTLDEADQKLPAGVGRIQKLLHQLSCSVFCADRAFFL